MIARWVAFWDARERPESLALVRILVPLVILWDFVLALAAGLVPDLWAPPPAGLGWTALEPSPPAVTRLLGASTGSVWFLFSAAALGAVLLMLGLFHRVAAFVLAWCTAALSQLAPDGERAIDMLLRTAVLILAFSRADACWSIPAWFRRRRGQAPVDVIPAWPRRLLFAQIVWMYSSAAHNRGGLSWWPWGGWSAIARILSDPHYARFGPGWIETLYPATQAATGLTMIFELGSPLLLLFAYLDAVSGRGGRVGELVRRRRLRFVYLGLGALLHLGIALTLRLGIFSFGMLALYPAFLRPAELRALGERARCLLRAR